VGYGVFEADSAAEIGCRQISMRRLYSPQPRYLSFPRFRAAREMRRYLIGEKSVDRM